MAGFKLVMSLDSAAFGGDGDEYALERADELGRILSELGNRLQTSSVDPGDSGGLRDINGNTVGRWEVTG